MIIQDKIDGERIYLRNLIESDASEEYCEWLNDEEVNKYLETRKTTIPELVEYIKDKNQSEDCLFLGIFDSNNDKHIGNIKLEPISFDEKKGKLGILLGDKSYWGKGIGREAMVLFIDYAFAKLGLNKVYLGVISENKKAIKSYKSLGFKITETLPESANYDGTIYDSFVMVLNKEGI